MDHCVEAYTWIILCLCTCITISYDSITKDQKGILPNKFIDFYDQWWIFNCTISINIIIALLSDAQPSRVARSIVLILSPRGARNEVLSSDGLTSLIKRRDELVYSRLANNKRLAVNNNERSQLKLNSMRALLHHSRRRFKFINLFSNWCMPDVQRRRSENKFHRALAWQCRPMEELYFMTCYGV